MCVCVCVCQQIALRLLGVQPQQQQQQRQQQSHWQHVAYKLWQHAAIPSYNSFSFAFVLCFATRRQAGVISDPAYDVLGDSLVGNENIYIIQCNYYKPQH